MGQQTEDGGPSKKRFAAGQLSRDNPGLEDDAPEPEMGTFQRASEEVLAARRIVKVRRHQTPSSTSNSSNPFAQISFSAPSSSDGKTAIAAARPSSTDNGGKPEDKKTTANEGIDPAKGEGEAEQNGRQDESGEKQGKEESENGLPEAQVKAPPPSEEKVNEDNKAEPPPSEEKVNEDNKAEPPPSEEKVNEDNKTEPPPSEEKVNEDNKAEPPPFEEKVNEDNKAEPPPSEEKVNEDNKAEPPPTLSSFQQLSSSQNAFSGLAGTGFSATSFTFGSSSSPSLFGLSGSKPAYPSFGIGATAGGTNLFNAAPSAAGTAGVTAAPTLQEVPVETGEENERPVFAADAVLFEYIDGGWKERGKGEVKVNVSNAAGAGAKKSRLIMRARGNLRLILNASLYPDMALTAMEKRGVTFACVNSSAAAAAEKKAAALATFALKFRDPAVVEEFTAVVEAHKGERAAAAALSTPENSPEASSSEE